MRKPKHSERIIGWLTTPKRTESAMTWTAIGILIFVVVAHVGRWRKWW